MMFHKHKWVKIKETYAPPCDRAAGSLTQDLAEKLAFGMTTILWECEICRKLRKEEMLGKGRDDTKARD